MGDSIIRFFSIIAHTFDEALIASGKFGFGDLLFFLQYFRYYIYNITSRDVLLALLFTTSGFAASALSYAVGCVIHLLATWLIRPDPSVFIPYQHEQSSYLYLMAEALETHHIKVSFLPFLRSPDHDTLIDQVRHAIESASAVICLPGPNTSFVESEVAMSFAMRKPILFILDPIKRPWLPDTAKRGYPIFDEQRMRERGTATFSFFCSYVIGNRESTISLYKGIYRHLVSIPILGILVYATSVFIMSVAINNQHVGVQPVFSVLSLSWQNSGDSLTLRLTLILVVALSVTHSAFFLNRLIVRHRVRNAITNRRFDISMLPHKLDPRFSHQALEEILWNVESTARHDITDYKFDNDFVAQASTWKLLSPMIVISFLLFIFLFLYIGSAGAATSSPFIRLSTAILFGSAIGLFTYLRPWRTKMIVRRDSIILFSGRSKTKEYKFVEFGEMTLSKSKAEVYIRSKIDGRLIVVSVALYTLDAVAIFNVIREKFALWRAEDSNMSSVNDTD
jgi:hypothetical protein